MVFEAYAENEVLHQDGVELVCLLYAKAIEKIGVAADHLERGRIPERAAAVGHAMAIVVELQSSLDLDAGGEIAKDLARLYDYIQQRLLAANAEQQAEPLLEAGRLLETLHEGWRECSTELGREPTAARDEAHTGASAAEPESMNAHAWTL